MKTRVDNRLAQLRKSRGVGASDLARRVHVSRQTIYAIEAGTYVPNTEVALNLARELEVTVDELFSLQWIPEIARVVGRRGAQRRSAGERPARAHLPDRIALGQRSRQRLSLLHAGSGRRHQANRAGQWTRGPGCLCQGRSGAETARASRVRPRHWSLSRMVEKISGVEIVSAAASSKLALTWLSEGKVHIAGTHLEDPKTGEFNLPFIRKQFPDQDFSVVTFARWEEGLVIASGNPKGVRKIEDLARKNVRFVNRELGSGSRALLDELLEKAGMDGRKVCGYDRVAYGHLAAAYCVLSREADVCLATRSAAQTFGLDFIPLHSERYDLVMRKRTADLPAAKAFLDILQRATLRRKLEVLAGYDTSETGVLVA